MKLDIPFYSQRDNKYRNDCGAATIACLVDRPIDDVLKAIGREPNKPLTFHNMYYGLRYFGLQYAYRNDIRPSVLRSQIEQGYPVIVLLTYGRLPKGLQALDFDGGFWALVTGYEDGFFYAHDSLRATEEGGYQVWDAKSLNMAMKDISAGNLPHQGLVIKKKYPVSQKESENVHILTRISVTADELQKQLNAAESEKAILLNYLNQLYGVLDIIEMANLAERQGKAVAKASFLKSKVA